ncbi:HAMP domain-containing histidine kinase [Sphingobacterium rhinopitheci]|nr:HAMP domain-containing histidine kinase [Sphingobacterium rhinopitheci]
MEKTEIQTVESKSLLAAVYYLEKDELSYNEHALITIQLENAISRSNIAIFNAKGQQVNGDMDFPLSKDFLEDVVADHISHYITDEYFYNGIFYKDNEGDFVVITRASKIEFNKQVDALVKILITISVISLFIIFVFSQLLGYIAYQPIVSIIDQIRKRKESNFYQPLELKKAYTEVNDLIITYNQFIDHIAKTFAVQKNFIDYVSHELRTPIAALFGTLDVTKQNKRSTKEYEEVLEQLNQYANDLQDTLDQMMLLSGAKTTFELITVRIDEVIWQVIEKAILYHSARIEVDINVSNDQLLKVNGNDKLLELALDNIVGNAIKYSDNQIVKLNFLERNHHLEIDIIDNGIGILAEDINQIKQNFYRGSNSKNYPGKGIGLSIANIIFSLHQINLRISPNPAGGTIVTLVFDN